MYEVQPVKCPKCGAIVISDAQTLTNVYLEHDIVCSCGQIIIRVNKTMC